jgi:hypothetical protein
MAEVVGIMTGALPGNEPPRGQAGAAGSGMT